MEFLKGVLGEELYNQFMAKLEAYNNDEKNKDSQIKLANLTSGEYVGKGKYEALQATLTSKESELSKANDLITQLKESNDGNQDLQTKITTYEGQITELQNKLAQEKVDNAVKVALLEAKATDIDYVTFKLKEKGEIKLDEKGHIANWEETLKSLKTQLPNQFETSQQKNIIENTLKTGDEKEPEAESLVDAIKQSYEAKKD